VALALIEDPIPYTVLDLSLPLPVVQIPAYDNPICGYQLAEAQPLIIFVVIGDAASMLLALFFLTSLLLSQCGSLNFEVFFLFCFVSFCFVFFFFLDLISSLRFLVLFVLLPNSFLTTF
jgi:hypothetical protein